MGTAVFQLPTWTLGVIPEHHVQPLVLVLKVTGVSLRPALRSSWSPFHPHGSSAKAAVSAPVPSVPSALFPWQDSLAFPWLPTLLEPRSRNLILASETCRDLAGLSAPAWRDPLLSQAMSQSSWPHSSSSDCHPLGPDRCFHHQDLPPQSLPRPRDNEVRRCPGAFPLILRAF